MRHKNNFIPTIRDRRSVLAFLTKLIRDGYSYSTTVKARSAISNVVSLRTNWNISKYPLISRFMKGTFSVQRPLPKHSAFWNVSHVLRYLSKIDSETCSLKDITHKVITLLCLASFGRVHTISLIRKSNVHFLANKSAIIFIYDDLKVKRPRQPHFTLEFPHFSRDRRLCVAHNLYLHRTRFLRALSQDQLFISYSPPHKPITKDSLSRWVKNSLSLAGIDTSIFMAHSVRGASSSACCSSGLSLPFILSRVDWSTDKTFKKFYNKPLLSKEEEHFFSLFGK